MAPPGALAPSLVAPVPRTASASPLAAARLLGAIGPPPAVMTPTDSRGAGVARAGWTSEECDGECAVVASVLGA
eukprot:11849138-Alexandrium_andersonii.AAC.1